MSAAIDYRRKIYAIRDLPTLPIIAQKILGLVDDDSAGAEKLARIISSDQSLSVKVLSLANSAYYGCRAQIGTVKQAVVVIGTEMLRQISLSVLIFKAMGKAGTGRTLFWRHSLMAANAASMAGKQAGIANVEVCFMGGLLHDVGKLVLDANLPEEYGQVRAIVTRDNCSFVEAEQAVFQIDHVEVGAWMAERWQLPAELVGAIGQHHAIDITPGPHSRIVAAVHTANAIAHATDVLAQAAPDQAVAVEVPEQIRAALGVPQPALDKIALELHGKRTQIERLLF
jgi:putative nucleotidyltransferase with HDIG domain